MLAAAGVSDAGAASKGELQLQHLGLEHCPVKRIVALFTAVLPHQLLLWLLPVLWSLCTFMFVLYLTGNQSRNSLVR